MNYALMVYSDQSAWESYSEEEAARLREEAMPAWIACFEELGKADPNLEGFELESASTAKVVCVDRALSASGRLRVTYAIRSCLSYKTFGTGSPAIGGAAQLASACS